MVGTVLGLRLRVLRAVVLREPWRAVLLGLGLLWVVSTLPGLLVASWWLARQPLDVRLTSLVVVGAALHVGWALVPVLVHAADDSLSPRRFAPLGLEARRLAPALVVASAVSLPALFALLVGLAGAGSWRREGGAALLAGVLAALCQLATCLLAARVTTALAARLLVTRAARRWTVLGALVVLVGGVVGGRRLLAGGLEGLLERLPWLTEVLVLTPLGAGWGVPAALVEGDLAAAAVRGVLEVGFVVGGSLLWRGQVHRLLVSPPSALGGGRRRRDAVLGAGRPALAVMRRCLRYWGGDPRYLGSIASSVVLPLLLVTLLALVGGRQVPPVVLLAPLLAGVLGWGRHNDTAFDGSAFWLHVASGLPGAADRLGRVLALLVWALPVVLALAVGVPLLAGRADLLAPVLGLALGLLGCGLGVSMVASVLLPYPAPRAGDSPFATEPGSVGASLLAQLVATLATGVLVAPVSGLFWLAVSRGSAVLGLVTGLTGLLGGGAVLAAGTVLGGRLLDARGARVLARLRV